MNEYRCPLFAATAFHWSVSYKAGTAPSVPAAHTYRLCGATVTPTTGESLPQPQQPPQGLYTPHRERSKPRLLKLCTSHPGQSPSKQPSTLHIPSPTMFHSETSNTSNACWSPDFVETPTRCLDQSFNFDFADTFGEELEIQCPCPLPQEDTPPTRVEPQDKVSVPSPTITIVRPVTQGKKRGTLERSHASSSRSADAKMCRSVHQVSPLLPPRRCCAVPRTVIRIKSAIQLTSSQDVSNEYIMKVPSRQKRRVIICLPKVKPLPVV